MGGTYLVAEILGPALGAATASPLAAHGNIWATKRNNSQATAAGAVPPVGPSEKRANIPAEDSGR